MKEKAFKLLQELRNCSFVKDIGIIKDIVRFAEPARTMYQDNVHKTRYITKVSVVVQLKGIGVNQLVTRKYSFRIFYV